MANQKTLKAPQMLRPKEVADRLAVSKDTIYNWIEDGTLPAIKIGERAVGVSEEKLAAWLDRRPHMPGRNRRS